MTTLPLDVERLTFGFDALAHHEGQVVFVPYAAPGDRVRAEVVERRTGYLRARVLEVVAPGTARVLPGCPSFPTCGGCQWQHVAPPAQRDAKRAVVVEQLARVGGMHDVEVLPTLPSPHDWAYRTRVTLAVEGRQAGYRRARSHALVGVAACPIAAPVVSAHLEAARAWIATLRMAVTRLTVCEVPGGVAFVARARTRPGAADVAACEAVCARLASVRGTVVVGGGARLVTGDPTIRVLLEPGLALEVPADAFTQVNAGANQLLVAAVHALGNVRAGERVLDLYCGAGNFTLPLARRGARVTGIEQSAVAVGAARANAVRLGIDATFRRATVERALARLAPGEVDAAVLDPPRRGAAAALAPLATIAPRRILYVSCDPATLARDVRTLAAHGYRLGRVQPVDLFPQTYHVESVAELHLT